MDRRIFDFDPGIERNHSLLIDEKRIDIEFANGPVLHGERAQLHEAKRKPLQIDGGPIPEPFQQFVNTGRFDEFARELQIERGEGHGRIANRLDARTARSE